MGNDSKQPSSIPIGGGPAALRALDARYEELKAARRAALNLMEDAVAAKKRADALIEELKAEVEARKRAEAALREAEQWRRLIIQSAEDYAIFTLDLERRVNTWNAGAQNVFGYVDADVIGNSGDIVFTPEDIEKGAPAKEAEEALREGRAGNERWHLRNDGSRFWGSGITHPMRDGAGRPIGFVKIMRDLTEQRQTEESLRQAHERIVEVLESTADAFYSLDADFNLTYVNARASRLWGRDADSLIGKHFWTEFPNAVGGVPYHKHHAAQDEGKAVHFETVSPVIGRWVDVSIYPGSDRSLSVFFRDISDRKASEEALRESEEKYRTLFDSMDEGYCIIQMIYDDAGQAVDWRFVQVNRAFAENNGLHDAEGKTIREMAPDIEPKWIEIYDRVARTGESKRFEEDSPALGRIFSLYAFRIGEPDERKVAVIFTDITERKKAEDSLRLSEERQSFLLRLSDELRPLSDPADIKAVASRLLGEHLRVNRVLYADVENDAWVVSKGYEEGVEAISDGAYPASTYGHWMMDTYRSGRNIVYGDSRTDERFSKDESTAHVAIGTIAAVGIPLVKAGRLLAILAVHDSKPRDWTFQEVSLVEETAERTWGAVERAHAEHAAREFDMRLRVAADATNLGVWEWNLDTNLVAWNEQHYRLVGLEPGAGTVDASEFFKRVHPDDREQLEEEIRQAVRETRVFDAVFRVVHDSGRVRWMSGYGRLTDFAADGQPTTMSGVMMDITDRMRMEEDLRISNERLRLLIESATDVSIFTTDRKGIVNSWNTGSARIYGFEDEEIIGKDVAVLFTDEDRKRGEHLREQEEAVRNGRALDERWHKRKDGTVFFASGLTQPIGEGGAEGFVKIARDMTERMRAEKARREKELMQTLVNAQELERRRIARDLHDELGQQLTALRLKLDRVSDEAPEPLEGPITEVKQIAKNIDDGVDFLAWELRPAALDDLGLVPAIEKFAKEWSSYSGVASEVTASASGDRRFEPAIETALYRVVQEALNNIHKHARAKNASISVRTRRGMVVMVIDDDGGGFDPDDPAARTRGMGLVGMNERVQMIGGTLEIESEPGHGTTLFVKAPMASEVISPTAG